MKCVYQVQFARRHVHAFRWGRRGTEGSREEARNAVRRLKRIFIELRTTTYESNNQPYVSKMWKIFSSVTRAFEQVLHVHVTTGAAIVVP